MRGLAHHTHRRRVGRHGSGPGRSQRGLCRSGLCAVTREMVSGKVKGKDKGRRGWVGPRHACTHAPTLGGSSRDGRRYVRRDVARWPRPIDCAAVTIFLQGRHDPKCTLEVCCDCIRPRVCGSSGGHKRDDIGGYPVVPQDVYRLSNRCGCACVRVFGETTGGRHKGIRAVGRATTRVIQHRIHTEYVLEQTSPEPVQAAPLSKLVVPDWVFHAKVKLRPPVFEK